MPIAPTEFTHLHVHSEYSLLDGLGRIDDLVSQASALGFDSLALTDHGALYGAIAFYQACHQRGLKPIIGVETYIARRSMADREGKADAQPFHLILLAKDHAGYRNLCRIVTDAHLAGYYYKPRVDRDYLAQHSEGLIGLSACLNGEVARALEVDDWDLARSLAGAYADIFGRDGFFLELQDHGLPEQRRLNAQLLRLAPEVGLPLVVTNDLHYVHQAQVEAHDVLLCVGTGANLDTPGRLRFDSDEFFLKSAAEMEARFAEVPEAIRNTRRIAEMTDLRLDFGQLRLPDFPVPEGHTVESWLRAGCERGLVTRYGSPTPELQARLDYELDVICRMGYAGYFLIVADFTAFAREQGIATTCRGSAPGSIVTYTLGITPVDPIAYQLPFERFLNPDRVTMPDIDVDFEDARRDEVIDYVTRKYGQDHVAQIITFGTMLARAAVRDVGRVMGYGYGEVDRIAKAIPAQLGIRLDEAVKVAPAFREMVETDPGIARLVGIARQLEGVARNASTHAAGVVISREPLVELMPLQEATNSKALMTQYDMHGVEALGLLKFDFLGLSNLTILRQAVELIAKERGGEPIDLERIPLDDARTFELLSSGETTGVFQLESPGMRRYVRELRPTSVHDLAAMVALFRPGPMDNIPAYIRRKHGLEPVTYLHPLLEPYLEKTYGIFVYQEDIMAAAMALGGFTGPEADTLGYAIRKKKSSVLRAQKDKFVRQAAERGVPPQTIDAVFKAFEPFERYGFNKAHATCYGLIAYQTAYLKANYPVEYMTSVLTAVRNDAERVAGAIAECRRLGIAVLPPDVHRSSIDFTVEGEAIRFGLLAVKNVGASAIESIIAAREAEGPFRSLADLCARVDLRLVNKRVLESLIKVGALDGLGHPAQLLLALDDTMAYGQSRQRDRESGQSSLFDLLGSDDLVLERPLPPATEAPSRERLRWEKELLGLYLSDHPLGELANELAAYVDTWSSELGEDLDQRRQVLGGVVVGVRRVITRNRETMAVATLEDLQGTFDVVIFPRTYAETGPTWADDAIVVVAGRVDHKGDETVLLADAVWTWEDVTGLGAEAFRREVAAGERGRRGNGGRPGTAMPVAVPVVANGDGGGARAEAVVIPRVSPLRGGGAAGTMTVVIGGPSGVGLRAAPRPDPPPPPPPATSPPAAGDALAMPASPAMSAAPAGLMTFGEAVEEPPLPQELEADLVREEGGETAPIEAGPGRILHVRFLAAPPDQVVVAFGELQSLIRARPGETPVVLHIPAAGGQEQLMQLSLGIAYDVAFQAEVRRRLGGLVELRLS